MKRIALLALIALPHAAFCGEQVGTLTQLQGSVMIFSHPSKKLTENLPSEAQGKTRALFDGEHYLVGAAKPGDRVEQGNIVRTAPGGKVRVVFDNGDQFNVGPSTSYRVSWNKDAKDGQVQIQLMYGKFRGIVEKGGPRSQLKIKTKAATMGVRGTDFFISEDPADGETEISILRGSMEVKPASAPPTAKPVEIATGFSASIAPPAPKLVSEPKKETRPVAPAPILPAVELRKTTQEDLIVIQKSSVIKPAPQEAAAPKEVAQRLQTLETKAVETALKDIKTHDPVLYAKIETRPMQSADELNTQAVENIFHTAPKAPERRRKPRPSELDDLEKDAAGAYDKYFKNIQ